MFRPVSFENKTKKWTTYLELCKSCGICVEKCPQKCLSYSKDFVGYYSTPAIDCDINKCITCKSCELFCPDSAIKVEKKA
jgi:2-oxoglutarate ferredoxin oxidoreductase subunit delta